MQSVHDFVHNAHETSDSSITGMSQKAQAQNKRCGEHLQTDVMQMYMHDTASGCRCAPSVLLAGCSLTRLCCQVELEQAVA